METVSTFERIELKNKLKECIIETRPQDLRFLTNSNVKFMLYYMNGYIKCLNEFSEVPLNESEVDQLIKEELLEAFNELVSEQSR